MLLVVKNLEQVQSFFYIPFLSPIFVIVYFKNCSKYSAHD